MPVPRWQVRSRATLATFMVDLTDVDTGPWQKHQQASRNRDVPPLLLFSVLVCGYYPSRFDWLKIEIMSSLAVVIPQQLRLDASDDTGAKDCIISFITVRSDAEHAFPIRVRKKRLSGLPSYGCDGSGRLNE